MTARTRPGRHHHGAYSYSRTYGRRRRPGLLGWADRHRQAAVLLAAGAILLAYTAACAYCVDRWSPSMTAAYWLAGLAVTDLAALLALVLWARRG